MFIIEFENILYMNSLDTIRLNVTRPGLPAPGVKKRT